MALPLIGEVFGLSQVELQAIVSAYFLGSPLGYELLSKGGGVRIYFDKEVYHDV